jgi:hypothetical protein
MRIHSLFTTMARALKLVQEQELMSYGGEGGSVVVNNHHHHRYDLIVVTRLDVIKLVHFRGRDTRPKGTSSSEWWFHAANK